MIQEHKIASLYGKKIFERVKVTNAFKYYNTLKNEACFLYLTEGINRSYSEDSSLVLNPNDGVLMQCGNHFNKGLPDKNSQSLSFLVIHLYPDVLLKIFRNHFPDFLMVNSSRNNDTNMTTIRSNLYVTKFVESIILYMDKLELMTDDMVEIKIMEFIQVLQHIDHTIDIRKIMSGLFDSRTVNFKHIIEAHIFSDLSIKELATLSNMSLASFKREFKKQFNDSPSHYIKKQRLSYAAELLSLSDTSISNIAYDCQFNNPAHFSTAFKEEFGISPSNYRKSSSNN